MPQEKSNIALEIKDGKITGFEAYANSKSGQDVRYTYLAKIEGKEFLYDSEKAKDGIVKLQPTDQKQIIDFIQSIIKDGDNITLVANGFETKNISYAETNRELMNLALKNSLDNNVIKTLGELGVDVSKETADKNITKDEYDAIAKRYNEGKNKSEIVKF